VTSTENVTAASGLEAFAASAEVLPLVLLRI